MGARTVIPGNNIAYDINAPRIREICDLGPKLWRRSKWASEEELMHLYRMVNNLKIPIYLLLRGCNG